MTNKHLIIFTDLDGTLLDLETYSYRGAEAALRKINVRNIPLIFCSSKTRSEQEYYQRKLGVDDPFIVENGAAIFIRKDYFGFEYMHRKKDIKYHSIEIGMPYENIREKLSKIREENGFEFRGYGDMTLEEVSALTGLDREAAQRARTREYSETIDFTDSKPQLQRFENAVQEEGLQCSHGGRFRTVTASSNDKGRAVRILKDLYLRAFDSIITVGLGDAKNDVPLLSEVDRPILLQRSEEEWQELNLPSLQTITGSGPEVWGGVISDILDFGENSSYLKRVIS